MGDSEADYLRETVGDALAKGCLKTALAAPSDPVEYLGTWLLKFVENVKIKEKAAQRKKVESEAKRTAVHNKEQAEAVVAKSKEEREKVIEDVQKIIGDPYKIWSAVASGISTLTPACCYVANLAKNEPGEAEITEEDLEEEEVEPEEPEEAAEEGAAEEEAAPAEEEAAPAEENETPEEEEPVTFTYEDRFLDFVVTSKDMEYILEKGLAFHRPVVEEESEEEPLPSALAFDILDKAVDSIDIPNVLYESRVKYFDKFPKVGAFYALPIKSKTGEIKAVLCSDTLAPTGNGKSLSADSKELIQSLVAAAGQAMDSTEEYFSQCDAKATAKALKEEITKALEPADAPEEGAEAPAAPAAEEGEEAAPEPSVAVKAVTNHVERVKKIATIIASKTDKISEDCMRYTNAPVHTFGVLKALMILSGYEAEQYSTWKGIRKTLSGDLFEKIQAIDLSALDAESYTRVRACTKNISRDELISETPISGMSIAAKMLLEEVKLAAKATVVAKIYDLAGCPHDDAINFEEFVAGLPGDKDESGALTSLKLGSTQFTELKETADKLAEAVAAVEKAAAEQAKAEADAAAAVAAAEAAAAAESEAAGAEGGEEAPAAEGEEPAAE